MMLSMTQRRCLYRALWLYQNPQKPCDMLRYFDKEIWKSMIRNGLVFVDDKKRLSITDEGVLLARSMFVSKQSDIDSMVATGRNLHDVSSSNSFNDIYSSML